MSTDVNVHVVDNVDVGAPPDIDDVIDLMSSSSSSENEGDDGDGGDGDGGDGDGDGGGGFEGDGGDWDRATGDDSDAPSSSSPAVVFVAVRRTGAGGADGSDGCARDEGPGPSKSHHRRRTAALTAGGTVPGHREPRVASAASDGSRIGFVARKREAAPFSNSSSSSSSSALVVTLPSALSKLNGGGSSAGSKKKQKRVSSVGDGSGKRNGRELQEGVVLEEDTNERRGTVTVALMDYDDSDCDEDIDTTATASAVSSGHDDDDDDDDGANGGKQRRVITTTVDGYVRLQRRRMDRSLPPVLYHDPDFGPVPSSVDGTNGAGAVVKCRCRPPQPAVLDYTRKKDDDADGGSRSGRGDNRGSNSKRRSNGGRPYHRCRRRRCNFFRWAYCAERMHWYRFGPHNGHVLVRPPPINSGGDIGGGGSPFSASDLVQGKVGDCWFLSALAVVAERPDLISRLFGGVGVGGRGADAGGGRRGRPPPPPLPTMNEFGIVEVTLFLDGYWTPVVLDTFLPCVIDGTSKNELRTAIRRSLLPDDDDSSSAGANAAPSHSSSLVSRSTSSVYDPAALSDANRRVLRETSEFLRQDRAGKDPTFTGTNNDDDDVVPRELSHRSAVSSDLAYSVARRDQLWVPLLEKAYAKAHGSYRAISGGHVSEAFLDLTGAPTLEYHFDSPHFRPREFWHELMRFRRKRLPMGCGTSGGDGGGGGGGGGLGEVGLVGMHAYSILDVREVRNVGVYFFRDELLSGSMGNVSGFTDFDGTVRLLRIRNPHGRGEWTGKFSDGSAAWERLIAHRDEESSRRSSRSYSSARGGAAAAASACSPPLHRTMRDDGTFWIDYDNFLMGFSNVDVVLAFEGNHGRSFPSNFPSKKSNHRCVRAFEVGLVDDPALLGGSDEVELFVMGIQKTRRGASRGRADRKKSYKVCDLGMIVGRKDDESSSADNFEHVEGRMFGFRRNGHYRLVLNRSSDSKYVVMPVSFGHPAATDRDMSFVLRFVSDAPLFIRELPAVPRMDHVIQRFCCCAAGPGSLVPSGADAGGTGEGYQGRRRILLEDTVGRRRFGEPTHLVFFVDCLADGGGTAFVYLWVNDDLIKERRSAFDDATGLDMSFSIEANCRGMVCRTEDGLLEHETVSKGQKFQAAWRRYAKRFVGEVQSRLLMVLVQSGVDTEMGSITCSRLVDDSNTISSPKKDNSLKKYFSVDASRSPPSKSYAPFSLKPKFDNYEEFGIFSGTKNIVGRSILPACRGQNHSPLPTLSSAATWKEGHDEELERALALSRGDLDLQRALDLSTRDRGKSDDAVVVTARPTEEWVESHASSMGLCGPDEQFDADVEKALAASTAANGDTSSRTTDVFSQELEEAIRRSLIDSGEAPEASSSSPTQTRDTCARRDGAVRSRHSFSVSKSDRSMPRTKGTTSGESVIELIDDSPSTQYSRGQGRNDKACDQHDIEFIDDNPTHDLSTTEKCDQPVADVSEKRRLAADAAMKRFLPGTHT